MKKICTILLACATFICGQTTSPAQVLISSFGSSISAGDLQGSWAGNYNSATSTVAGTATDFGGGIIDLLSSSLNISGMDQLSLTASNFGSTPGTFTILLYDSEFDSVQASFSWAAFSPGPQAIVSSLSTNLAFDPSSVIAWELATTGSGAAVNMQFFELSAVPIPEPATAAMIVGAFSLLALRRRWD